MLLSNINKSFDNKQVLRDISLELPESGFLTIMGPSGCGKTTLAKIILGFVKPDSGEITGNTRRISAVFQEDRLIPWLSVYGNIELVISDKTKSEKASLVRELLSKTGLSDSENKPSDELSGGMKRRAAIARALAVDFDVLVLDEAFKGLDKEMKLEIMTLVKTCCQGKCAVFITHDISEAEFMGGELLEIRNGLNKIENC